MKIDNLKNVTIVLILYNTTDLIYDLLNNLKNFNVIIVDNGNNKEVIEKIRKNTNVIKIISKNKNLGYAKAVNFAFENIFTDFFLVINPDLVISEKSIINLMNVLKNNNNCVVAAPITTSDKDYYGIFYSNQKYIT